MDQFAQAGLVDRDLAFLQPFDLGRDLVDADDVVPALGQASPLNQAHISRPDHCDFHQFVATEATPLDRQWRKSRPRMLMNRNDSCNRPIPVSLRPREQQLSRHSPLFDIE